jgi:hypothetical protein
MVLSLAIPELYIFFTDNDANTRIFMAKKALPRREAL